MSPATATSTGAGEPRSALPRPRLERLPPRVTVLVLVAGVLADFGIRAGVAALASAAAVLAAVAAVRHAVRTGDSDASADVDASGEHVPPAAAASARAAALPWAIAAVAAGVLLPLRASPWLTGIDALAVAVSLVGLALAEAGFDFRMSTTALVEAIGRGLQSVFAPAIAIRSVLPTRRGAAHRLAPVARGLALAAVPVMVLGALLASADAIFARAVRVDIDPGPAVGHVVFSMILCVALIGVIAIASSGPVPAGKEWRPVGHVEATVVLASVGALFALFAGVQLYGALGRADAILDEEGLTYAEYARSGYFQLLWVAALTAIGLAGVRIVVDERPSGHWSAVRTLGAVVSLLTLVVIAAAVVRLDLYTDEFGQTMTRWYSRAFAGVLGAGFLLVAIGHGPRLQRHLPPALAALIAGAVLAVNLLNPEARVAEHNLARADAATELDADYLLGLSADAWPVLLAHANQVEANLGPRRALPDDAFASACRAADEPGGYGLLGANLARVRLSCD